MNKTSTRNVQLGKWLKADEYHAGVLRMIIIARQSDTLVSAVKNLDRLSPRFREDQVILMSLYLASLKELTDSVRYMHSKGYLQHILDPKCPFQDLRSDAKKAIKLINGKDPGLIHNKLLERVRNNAGYHINVAALIATLDRHKSDTVTAMKMGADGETIESIPMIAFALADIISDKLLDLSSLLSETIELHKALTRIALDLLIIPLRVAEGK